MSHPTPVAESLRFSRMALRATTTSDGRAGRVLLPGSCPSDVHRRGATSALQTSDSTLRTRTSALFRPSPSCSSSKASTSPSRSLRSRLRPAVTVSPSRALLFPAPVFHASAAFPLARPRGRPKIRRASGPPGPFGGATPLLSRFPLKGIPSGNAGARIRGAPGRPHFIGETRADGESGCLHRRAIP